MSGPALSNMATSRGFPWTTGRITITHPAALGTEQFVLSGMDNRTASGQGTIQLVSGSLSLRMTSGPNANRAWVQLELTRPTVVPSFSTFGLLALCGSLLAIAAYVAIARRGRRVEIGA
jgi:hypothetical protein